MPRSNILDSPPASRPSRHSLSQPQRASEAAPRDLLAYHLGQLIRMAGKVADGCTNAAEDLAEAHLEDQVNTICDDLYLVSQTPELEEALKSLLWSRKQLEELQSYYTRSSDSIQSANEEQLKRICEEIKTLLSADVDVARFPELRSFQRRVFAARHPDQAAPMENEAAASDEDADIVISRATQSCICPISQREFEEPVRNPACGHVYSNQAIRQLVGNDTASCPVAGCRASVNIRSLQPDAEMEARLQRLRNRIFS